jgi:hypothetical protein
MDNSLCYIVSAIIGFLFMGVIVMITWNNAIVYAFGRGIVQRISFVTALGITLFLSVSAGFGSGITVVNSGIKRLY